MKPPAAVSVALVQRLGYLVIKTKEAALSTGRPAALDPASGECGAGSEATHWQ